MAGDRQVGIDVRAKVTGQKDVEKLARDVDKLTSEPATLEVDAKVNPAIDRALDKLEQLDQSARAAAVAAEALGQAVGPELAARADMTAVVNELKRMGLTFEEITANAGELGAKLSAVDSDDLGGRLGKAMGTARGETEKLSDAANKSRNALANMVGNTAQDMGALGGVAGSLGVGLGQLAEGAADAAFGGQKLSSALVDVAKVAGPVAALGVAMQLLSSAMEAAQASRAFDAANVDQYADALRDGVSAVKSFNDEIRETGELAFRSQVGGGPLGMFASTQDLLPVLERAKISVAQFNTIVDEYVAAGDGSAEANERWRRQLEAAGVSMLDAIDIVKAANQETDARVNAVEQDARVTALLGDSEADQAAAARESAQAERERHAAMEAGQAVNEYNLTLQQEAADMYDRVTEKLREHADALNDQVDASVGAADAQRAENDALARYAEVLDDAESSTDDQVDAAVALAKAHDATADATARAAGSQRTATEKVDAFNAALFNTAGTLNGPARTAVANYIADVNRVPQGDIRTWFVALVEQGKLDEARQLLTDTSATRTAAIKADATETEATSRELNELANPGNKPRTAYINAQLRYAQNFPNEISPGAGPRAVLPAAGDDGTVTPATLGAPIPYTPSPMGVSSSPAVFTLTVPAPTVNVTLQSAVIGSPTAVARAVRKATRDGVRLAGSR